MAKSTKDLSKAREALTQVRAQYSVIQREKAHSKALEREKTELKRQAKTGSSLSNMKK